VRGADRAGALAVSLALALGACASDDGAPPGAVPVDADGGAVVALDETFAEGVCLDADALVDGLDFDDRDAEVPCDEPHVLESVGTIVLREDDVEDPTDEELSRVSLQSCLDAVTDYLGQDVLDAALTARVLRPLEASWAAGDRTVSCFAYTEHATLDRSVRNTDLASLWGPGVLSSFNLTKGVCLAAEADLDAMLVPSVPCTEPHGFEVISWTALWAAGADHPGDQAVRTDAEAFCQEQLDLLVGAEQAGGIDLTALRPSESSWTLHGDREVSCVVVLAEPAAGTLAELGG
jgi:hypothetical protein